MRIDEIEALDVSLNDVLKSAQFIKLLRRLKVRSNDLNTTRIKNRIIQAWKQGKKSRKHFDSLLAEIDTNVDTLLQEQD
jgi:argonaute-like protein implicated in RNA metabolism and viral defense